MRHSRVVPWRDRPMSECPLFTTSWDDGIPSDIRVAEVLQSYGFVGTFYASTGPGGARSIGDDDLRRIGQQHELGNHGRSHRNFASLSVAEIAEEIQWAHRELSRFGQPARIVAPPNGRMTRQTVEALRRFGYQARSAPVLGTRSPRATWIEPSLQLYPHTWSALARNTARRRLLPASPLLRTWAKGGPFRQRTLDLVRVASQELPCVHLWGHSEEIDRLNLWDALEDILRHARDLHVRPATNTEAARAL